MKRDLSFLESLSGDALRAAIAEDARTQGALAAYRSALEICDDPKASPSARASSQRVILDMAGFLDRSEREANRTKDPSEMSADEIDAAVRRLRGHRALLSDNDGAFS